MDIQLVLRRYRLTPEPVWKYPGIHAHCPLFVKRGIRFGILLILKSILAKATKAYRFRSEAHFEDSSIYSIRKTSDDTPYPVTQASWNWAISRNRIEQPFPLVTAVQVHAFRDTKKILMQRLGFVMFSQVSQPVASLDIKPLIANACCIGNRSKSKMSST
jgi:hypothetical protein